LFPVPARTLPETLQNSARSSPAHIALIQDDRKLSYQQLHEAVTRLAFWMEGVGCKRGDRVLIFLQNSIELAQAVYATSLAGGVFVVVNPDTPAAKLHYLLEDCRPHLVITQNSLHARVEKAISGLTIRPTTLLSSLPESSWPPEVDASEKLENSPAIPVDLAALIYTSGSTGEPKGVMMTHQNMVFAAGSIAQYLRLDSSHRIMCALPLSFDYGLYQILMGVLVAATVIIAPEFRFPGQLIQSMNQYGATVFPAVPTMFSTLIQLHERSALNFPTITRVTNTAAALAPSQIPKIQDMFPNGLIFKMYGLTECKRVSYLEPELVKKFPASVGKAMPGTEANVLDESGKTVPPGTPGILHVRGPHVMAGYWNKTEETAKMLVSGPTPGEKMLRTGDWFIQNEEGFLFFQGRDDDMIKTRGQKVSPKEIENFLHSIGGVAEAIVLPVPHPALGQGIRAVVVPVDGVSLNRSLIIQECREGLESYMIPQEILFLRQMPLAANGKIDRKALSQLKIQQKAG
jgi:long-chain acyl-CoA synthetase